MAQPEDEGPRYASLMDKIQAEMGAVPTEGGDGLLDRMSRFARGVGAA